MSESLTPIGDSLAPETRADPRVIAELKKLNLEVDKIEIEIRHLRRPFRHPSAFIPILTSLIALLGGVATVWVTTQWKNEAVDEKNVAVAEKARAVNATVNAESDTKTQKSYAESLENVLDKANLEGVKTVITRFRGALTREDITALQQGLIADGFVATPPIRTEVVTQSSVSYYASDSGLADEVLKRVVAFFDQRGCPIRIDKLSEQNNKPGTIRLDIFHSCRAD